MDGRSSCNSSCNHATSDTPITWMNFGTEKENKYTVRIIFASKAFITS